MSPKFPSRNDELSLCQYLQDVKRIMVNPETLSISGRKCFLVVAKPRIELGTQGFSVLCSTD